jgi:hypothetical protein
MKVKIINIHHKDAWFSERDDLIGLIGWAYGVFMTGHHLYAFDFKPEHLATPINFQFAEFEVIR